MASLTTRAGKGSPLTNNELDANFNNLNAEVTPSRPTVRPSLLLDFAQTKQLDPRITFSRASTATYYDGKSVVKAEENLITYSQVFDNAAWAGARYTVTANSTVAPDGTSTAYSFLQASGNTNSAGIYHVASQITGAFTSSIYAKAGAKGYIVLATNSGTNRTWFDLINGIVKTTDSSHTPKILAVGNGWYRCSVTTASATGNSFYLGDADGSYTVIDNAGGVYIWGAQLEQRAYATAYTPTTSAAITNYIPAMQTAASGTARFDHDPVTGESKGLLIEEQRTNLYSNSQQFECAPWSVQSSQITVFGQAAIAPNGTASAYKIIESTTANSVHLAAGGFVGVSASTNYTASIYAKAGERYKARLVLLDGGSGVLHDVNLQTGTTINSASTFGTGASLAGASISPVGNGWYRITVSGYAATANLQIRLEILDNSGARQYTGDGASGLYIWGAQLEAGAFATSYIPTPLTYTGRASTATYKAADGLIRIAGNDVARYEPNAAGGSNLLLEGAVTNLIANTDTQSSWSFPNIGYSYGPPVTAPDGSLIYSIYKNSTYYVLRNNTSINPATITYPATFTFSFWAKAVSAAPVSIAYDIGDGTATQTFSITSSWNRYTHTTTVTSSANMPSGGFVDFAFPDNTCVAIWGIQLEYGSVATSYIPSTETHTGRSSTATYYDSTGTIRTAASGQPRYTYNPSLLTAPPKLLLEAQATNVLTNSITTWPSGNIAYATGAATAPDGSTTALSWTESASYTYQRTSAVFSHTDGNVYTFSVYAKAGTRDWVTLDYSPTVYFNLKTGQINAPVYSGLIGYGSVNVGNGWWRCWVTYQKDGFPTMYMGSSASGADGGLYTGSNAAPAIYTWGAQKEVGYAPTSYIPTTGTSVTRAADTSTSAAGSRAADVYSSSQVTRSVDYAGMFGSNFSSWYNNKEWSVYTESAIPYGMGMGTTANFQPSSAQVGLYGGSTSITAYREGHNTGASAGVVSISNTGFNKTASAFVASTATAYGSANGSSVTSASVLNMENTSIYFGYGLNGPTWTLNGWIKRFAYYPKRLSNSELQGLTS